MTLNILITTGTSQLDDDKLDLMGISPVTREGFFRDLLMRDRGLESPPPRYLRDVEQNEYFAGLVERLVDQIGGMNEEDIINLIGGEMNPLGAEISTLIRLKMRGGDNRSAWIPERDNLVILASETYRGEFSARILKNVIHEVWSVPDTHVKIKVIHELRDRNPNPESATTNLARAISDELRPVSGSYDWHNMIVVTGGYKSIIPCATIFSFLFGVELVYLFEYSSKLQGLHPWLELDHEENKRDWGKFLKMIQKNWGNEAGGCFSIAINKRLEDPYAKF